MVKLGLDMFSLRSQGWTAFEQLEFCARHGVQVVHYSEVRLLGGLDPDHLRRLRERADALDIALEIGMLSIAPGSVIFNGSSGSAEDQIARMIEPARLLGSPYIRCVVGAIDDRRQPGGIDRLMTQAVDVLKRVRSRVTDAGLKLALENHAGDLQARELKTIVEEAGRDAVGVCLDAGNALWAIEDPHLALDLLAPYVLTSHTRDSRVWRVPEGAAVAWTRMGEGNVRIEEYLRTFLIRCPGRPIMLEIIVTPRPRVMAYRTDGFWEAYRSTPAWEFDRFAALAETGTPYTRPTDDETRQEVEDVEISLEWTRAFLARQRGAPIRP